MISLGGGTYCFMDRGKKTLRAWHDCDKHPKRKGMRVQLVEKEKKEGAIVFECALCKLKLSLSPDQAFVNVATRILMAEEGKISGAR